MRSVEEHLDDILAGVRELPVESVPLDAALGRVLAREVTATTAIPPFDNSAMDGYAVRAEDVRGASDTAIVSLPVSADLPAGAAADARLEPGTAARIMTGAPVPPGADAIVPVEHTDGGTASVRVHREAPLGAHVRRAGTDLEAGATVLPPGATLTSRAIAAAA
ncbi:MAG: molybdopterin molybdenumtransferase MoeA, partial [Actinobacteria bacterium]|nr:molybdopterin molybdenumtransferase MoeA [Actinomycetota bacterium]